MAAVLGMTRREVSQKHSSHEIAEWMAFYQIEPEMFYPGAIPAKKKGKKKQTPEEMKDMMMGLVRPNAHSEKKQPIRLRNKRMKRKPIKKRK